MKTIKCSLLGSLILLIATTLSPSSGKAPYVVDEKQADSIAGGICEQLCCAHHGGSDCQYSSLNDYCTFSWFLCYQWDCDDPGKLVYHRSGAPLPKDDACVNSDVTGDYCYIAGTPGVQPCAVWNEYQCTFVGSWPDGACDEVPTGNTKTTGTVKECGWDSSTCL